MVTKKSLHLCWLCGKDADLTTCKIDEHGKAVHEACYTARLALEASAHKGPPIPFPPRALIGRLTRQ
jgi:hypothetical protein